MMRLHRRLFPRWRVPRLAMTERPQDNSSAAEAEVKAGGLCRSLKLRPTRRRRALLFCELVFALDVAGNAVTRGGAGEGAFSFDALEFAAAAGEAPGALLALQSTVFRCSCA